MTPTRHITRRRGFVMIDMIGGLILATVLLLVVVGAVRQYQSGALQVARARQAAALAERVLVDLQLGREAPNLDDGDTTVTIRAVDGGESFAAKKWVSVSVTYLGRTVEITGVVPARAVEAPR
ncbi:MAG: hypothetical protein GC159_04725 [Phycisphaera sp.]|nr:hypothetical protein [Phycisphaera sp.]